MNSLVIYPWQTAYVSAILEFDPKRLSARTNEAVRVIHEAHEEAHQTRWPRIPGNSGRTHRNSHAHRRDYQEILQREEPSRFAKLDAHE